MFPSPCAWTGLLAWPARRWAIATSAAAAGYLLLISPRAPSDWTDAVTAVTAVLIGLLIASAVDRPGRRRFERTDAVTASVVTAVLAGRWLAPEHPDVAVLANLALFWVLSVRLRREAACLWLPSSVPRGTELQHDPRAPSRTAVDLRRPSGGLRQPLGDRQSQPGGTRRP